MCTRVILTTLFASKLVLTYFSQPYLHVNHKKSLTYKIGDELRLLYDGRKIAGEIALFTDSSLVFRNRREIILDRIGAIYRENPRKGSVSKIYTATIILPLIDIANNGYPVDDNVWKISSGLLMVALVIQILHRKKLKIRNATQLLIIANSS